MRLSRLAARAAGRRPRPTPALRFSARLVGTFAATLALVGVVQYKLLAHRFESTLVAERAEDHKADAASLVAAFHSAEGTRFR